MQKRIKNSHRLTGVVLFFAVGLCLISITPEVLAHTVFRCLTRIDHNASAGTVEVIHRITGHDLEAVLSRDIGRKVSFLDEGAIDDLVAQTRILVEEAFAITMDGQAMTLTTVGMETDGDAILVYQEGPLAQRPDNLSVTHRLFLEDYPGQENIVIMKFGEAVVSLTLTKETPTDNAVLPAFDAFGREK